MKTPNSEPDRQSQNPTTLRGVLGNMLSVLGTPVVAPQQQGALLKMRDTIERMKRDHRDECDALRKMVAGLEKKRKALELEVAELHEACRHAEDLSERALELETALHAANNQLESEQRQNRELAAALEEMQALGARLWPDFLEIDELKPYEERWSMELVKEDADPAVLCMFANIFAWNCANELARATGGGDTSLERIAIPSLHAFSRFLLEWLHNNGVSPNDAQDISYQLAESVNRHLEETNAAYRINLHAVMLGDPLSNLMQPRLEGRETGRVKRIYSWCITSANGNACITRADVLLA